MIEIFGATGGANGVGADPTALAHGISVALYNTAFGLIVAIRPICHRHFRTRIDGYTMADGRGRRAHAATPDAPAWQAQRRLRPLAMAMNFRRRRAAPKTPRST